MGNVCHRSGQSSAVFRCIDIILTQAETAGCQQELEDKIRNLLYTEAVLYMGNYFIRPNRLMIDDLEDLFQPKRFYDFWFYNSYLLSSDQDSSKRKGFVFKVSVQASNSCDDMSQKQGKCPIWSVGPHVLFLWHHLGFGGYISSLHAVGLQSQPFPSQPPTFLWDPPTPIWAKAFCKIITGNVPKGC